MIAETAKLKRAQPLNLRIPNSCSAATRKLKAGTIDRAMDSTPSSFLGLFISPFGAYAFQNLSQNIADKVPITIMPRTTTQSVVGSFIC